MDLERLLRQIYITRKSRIEASERIKRKKNFYDFIFIYYSLFLVGLSVWNINNNVENKISLLILIASISLSLFSVYIKTKNFQERYFNIKIMYIELDKIYEEIKIIKDDISPKQYLEFKERYNTLLKQVENHGTVDYLKFRLYDSQKKLSIVENITLYCAMIKDILVKLFFIVIPIVTFYLIF